MGNQQWTNSHTLVSHKEILSLISSLSGAQVLLPMDDIIAQVLLMGSDYASVYCRILRVFLPPTNKVYSKPASPCQILDILKGVTLLPSFLCTGAWEEWWKWFFSLKNFPWDYSASVLHLNNPNFSLPAVEGKIFTATWFGQWKFMPA